MLQILREGDFPADAAYPGQSYPPITQPVAAVHIEDVDRESLKVTVEVMVLCPAAMGGTQAEIEALGVVQLLRQAGAACLQKGCSYDGVARVYLVPIQAVFTGAPREDSFFEGPGFTVTVGSTKLPYAMGFQAEQSYSGRTVYAAGESVPQDCSRGNLAWQIQVEELIPPGASELSLGDGVCQVTLAGSSGSDTYSGCCWTRISREYTRDGLRRIHRGTALGKESMALG